jgi:outer membrane murein-binding lipoprotein Lpp
MKSLKTVFVSILLTVCLAHCASKEKSPQLTADQNAAKSRLEAQMKETARTNETYRGMDNATLLTRLTEQSKALREPFNSLAYRELKTRTNLDPTALTKIVNANQNVGGLLPLLLLRRLDNRAYLDVSAETRGRVLTDALQASKTFNTWGLPGVYLEDASNAMFEAGVSTFPALKRMLAETRPAPLFGSKEYMLAQRYQYRLCDYALFFLKRIQGDAKFTLPMPVNERDALIKAAQ